MQIKQTAGEKRDRDTGLIWGSLIPAILAALCIRGGLSHPAGWGWWAGAAFFAVEWISCLYLGHCIAMAEEYPGEGDL